MNDVTGPGKNCPVLYMEEAYLANIPVTKNQEIELNIDDLGAEGQGVGRYSGYAVFVPGALPGETVRVRVVKAGKAFGFGKLLEVVGASAQRVDPICEAFGRCGGCTLMHLSYEGQLAYKRERVRQALLRIGRFEDAEVLPVIGMNHPTRYRNKGAFSAGTGEDAAPALGLYAARSHRLVPVGDCVIEHPACAAAMGAVTAWMREHGAAPYDEESGKGLVRHLVVRTSAPGEAMAIVCTNGQKLPAEAALVRRLREAVPGLVSVAQCAAARPTNVIMDGPVRIVWGANVIRERIAGLELALSPRAFFQVNTRQAEKLYEHAVSLSGAEQGGLLLDAYCGIGAIGLLAARRGARVIGVESVEEAVRDAEANASRNGLTNIRFVCGKAEEVIPKLLESGEKPDAVVLDPPRKGCEAKLLEAIANAGIERVVYVSCNPATLARDLALMAEHGYAPGPVQPVDMFPHTAHVECVVGVERVEK